MQNNEFKIRNKINEIKINLKVHKTDINKNIYNIVKDYKNLI